MEVVRPRRRVLERRLELTVNQGACERPKLLYANASFHVVVQGNEEVAEGRRRMVVVVVLW
jgi:hypothetical protein